MQRRERFEREGPDTFGDAELLAVVLGTGTAGRTALQIAASLLDTFGGLPGLRGRQPQELRALAGIGQERAVRLLAALEVGRRALRPTWTGGDTIRSARDAWPLLGPGLQGRLDEELHGLFLDRRMRPVALRRLTTGSPALTVVDPRQVYRVALAVHASAVVLAHNHPSGDPEPSRQDRNITNRLARAGEALGIPLLDHLVVGDTGFRSLAEAGARCSWSARPSGAWTHDAEHPREAVPPGGVWRQP